MRLRRTDLALLVLAVGLAACSAELESPVDVDPTLTVVPGTETLTVEVCKTSFNSVNGLPDDGTLGRTFDFLATASGGTLLNPNPTLEARTWEEVRDFDSPLGCQVVWERPATSFDDETVITVTEIVPDDATLESVSVWYDDGQPDGNGVLSPYVRGGNPSVTLVPLTGVRVFFKNSTTEGGDGGGQGCTPGYWRQPHHYDSWVGVSPGDSFAAVFGVGPEMSLGDAVRLKGGRANALIRHAVAALLNANSPDVDYNLSSDDIIDLVQSAFSSGEFEDVKDMFDEFNNQGCELN